MISCDFPKHAHFLSFAQELKSSAFSDTKNYRNTFIAVLLLFVTVIPLKIWGTWGSQLCGHVANAIMCCVVVILVGGGFAYAHRLNQLLQGDVSGKKRRRAIQNIMWSVYVAQALALVTICVVILNMIIGIEPHFHL
jgi:hypothetical protein